MCVCVHVVDAAGSVDGIARETQAPTKGFAPRVGRRTTFRVLNRQWVMGYSNQLRGCASPVSHAPLRIHTPGIHHRHSYAMEPLKILRHGLRIGAPTGGGLRT